MVIRELKLIEVLQLPLLLLYYCACVSIVSCVGVPDVVIRLSRYNTRVFYTRRQMFTAGENDMVAGAVPLTVLLKDNIAGI